MAEKFKEIPNESIYEEQLSPMLQKKLRQATIASQFVSTITTSGGSAISNLVAQYYVEIGVQLPTAAMRIDGRLPSSGDLVVVAKSVDATKNGLYKYNPAGEWQPVAVAPGMIVVVLRGDAYQDTVWVVSGQPNALEFVSISRFLRTTLERRTDSLIGDVKRRLQKSIEQLICRICKLDSDVGGVVFSANTLEANLSLLNNTETYLQFQNIEVSSSYVSHSGGGIQITKPGLYFVDTMIYDENANTSGLIKLRIRSPYDSIGPQAEDEVDRFTNTFCDLHGSRICGIKDPSDNIIVSLHQTSGATWTLNNPIGGFHHAWVRVFRIGTLGQNIITNSP